MAAKASSDERIPDRVGRSVLTRKNAALHQGRADQSVGGGLQAGNYRTSWRLRWATLREIIFMVFSRKSVISPGSLSASCL